MPHIESISAITLVTADMGRAVRFYEALGFEKRFGGETSDFTTFRAGDGYLNLALQSDLGDICAWGRTVFYVSDVDAMHARVVEAGFEPMFEPRDAAWGERYFHVRDPDGHEMSFACLLVAPA